MLIVIPISLFLVLSGIITFIIFLVKNPELLDKWIYLINKFSLWKNEKTERKVISSNLDYKISSLSKQINKEAEGIIPFGLRIKWSNLTDESYTDKDNVIVVLKKEDNNDKNIINACMAFIPQALLSKSRNCIDARLLDNIDKYFIKRLLVSGNYDSAYNYFMKHIYNYYYGNSKENKEIIDVYSKLDEIGFFTRVLLEEYRRIGSKLYGTMDEQSFIAESWAFFEYLKHFTQRSPGDNTKLYFDGTIIKIAIILIAKKVTLESRGVGAYVNRLERHINEFGVQRVYVFSYSQRFEEAVNDEDGYVIGIKRTSEFKNLREFEEKCKDLECARLIKKQTYLSSDVKGKRRKSKYLIYETVR